MKRIYALSAFLFAAILSGCSSERDVDFEVVLKAKNNSVTIECVHFTTTGSMSKTARPPKLEVDGTVKHDHTIDTIDGNFVIVDLLRDGEPLHSEIFKLDSKILAKIGNRSEWVKPDGLSTEGDQLKFRLMRKPESFKPATGATEFFTELRYTVAKPYSY